MLSTLQESAVQVFSTCEFEWQLIQVQYKL